MHAHHAARVSSLITLRAPPAAPRAMWAGIKTWINNPIALTVQQGKYKLLAGSPAAPSAH